MAEAEARVVVANAIAADAKLGNVGISAAVTAGKLKLTSQSYGNASEIGNLSGSALSAMGYSGTESDTGLDVAGHFVVNGVVETAQGRGRLLTGDSNNAVTADMQLRVLFDASDVQAGSESQLTVSRGYAAELDREFGEMLDPVNGRFKLASDSYDRNVESVDKSIDLMNALFKSKQQYLIEQFTAMETAVSQLQNTGNFLAAQLNSLATFKK